MAKKKIGEASDAKPQEEVVAAEASATETKSSKKRRAAKEAAERRAAKEAGASGTGGAGPGAGQPKLLGADDPLVEKVVDMILKGIAEPGSQEDGKAFVPSDWATAYKPKLGPYKKFLLAHPDKLALVEDGSGLFTIKRPGDVTPTSQAQAPKVKGTTWQKMLTNAWMAYCLVVPREKRDFNAFVEPLPRAARIAAAGSPAATAAAADPSKQGQKRKHEEADCTEASTKQTLKEKKKHKKQRPTEIA